MSKIESSDAFESLKANIGKELKKLRVNRELFRIRS